MELDKRPITPSFIVIRLPRRAPFQRNIPFRLPDSYFWAASPGRSGGGLKVETRLEGLSFGLEGNCLWAGRPLRRNKDLQWFWYCPIGL
ncbi:MAG: hypothetical protein WBE41_01460 [Terracidiphilus sp.]